MSQRSLIALLHDLLAGAIAWVLAYLLRFNLDLPDYYQQQMLNHLLWLLPIQVLILWRTRLYQGLWRYASVADLRRVLIAAALSGAAVAVVAILASAQGIPRSVIVLYPVLLAMIMGGSRFLYRMWREGRLIAPTRIDAKRVAILGAGVVGTSLLRSLTTSRDLRVVAFFDDDPRKVGQTIGGVPVVGKLEALPEARARFEIEQAIIALPNESHGIRRRAFAAAADANIPAYAVPGLDDLASGRVQIAQIRRVELDDLLGRDPISLDALGLASFLGGKRILVTGAGGSIGSELCRQIARFVPATLILFDASEFALYNIEEEFKQRFKSVATIALVGDIKDAERIDHLFATTVPQVVFHAAAYKHVPLMENDNAWEAARNNILGTCRVANAAHHHHAEAFVLISTDKAVNPTNVMGATKRVAELVVLALQATSDTKFVTVRFGNVLGSTGSVVPKFRQQIAAGGPVTVTDERMTRYFMLIPEATQLVLQAALMGQGGDLLALDMGEPVRIVDLARDMIRLSGFSENDIKIEFSGLRPGEKLFEEVLADRETTIPTTHPKLRMARAASADAAVVVADLVAWLEDPQPKTAEAVRARLAQHLPEYRPAAQ